MPADCPMRASRPWRIPTRSVPRLISMSSPPARTISTRRRWAGRAWSAGGSWRIRRCRSPSTLGPPASAPPGSFDANGTLTEKPWVLRQHQAFRAVADPSILLGDLPTEFTSRRLVGRSVWNTEWKIIIPAYTLLNNEQEGPEPLRENREGHPHLHPLLLLRRELMPGRFPSPVP